MNTGGNQQSLQPWLPFISCVPPCLQSPSKIISGTRGEKVRAKNSDGWNGYFLVILMIKLKIGVDLIYCLKAALHLVHCQRDSPFLLPAGTWPSLPINPSSCHIIRLHNIAKSLGTPAWPKSKSQIYIQWHLGLAPWFQKLQISRVT